MTDPRDQDDELDIGDEDAQALLSDAVDEAEDDNGDQGHGTGRSEAARWRLRLRESEAQLQAVSERLSALQRAAVERIAAAHLAAGSDLWLTGTQLDELLTEDGDVDKTKVTEAARAAAAARPHWQAHSRPPGKPHSMLRGGGAPGDPTQSGTSTDWTQVLGGKR